MTLFESEPEMTKTRLPGTRIALPKKRVFVMGSEVRGFGWMAYQWKCSWEYKSPSAGTRPFLLAV